MNTIQIIAEAQKTCPTVAVIDLSGSFDWETWTAAGVDCTTLILAQPKSEEEAVSTLEWLVCTGVVQAVFTEGFKPSAKVWQLFKTAERTETKLFRTFAGDDQARQIGLVPGRGMDPYFGHSLDSFNKAR